MFFMDRDEARMTVLRRLAAITARTLAQSHDFDPVFEGEDLPEGILLKPKEPCSLSKIRAIGDALAMRQRFHCPEIHRRWLPVAPSARLLFSIAEQVRCESLGSLHLLGVRANLAFNYGLFYKDLFVLSEQAPPLEQIVGFLIRERLLGLDLSGSLRTQLINHQEALYSTIGGHLARLEQSVASQMVFAHNLIIMLRVLGLESERYQQDSSSSDLAEQCEEPGLNEQATTDTAKNRQNNPMGHYLHETKEVDPSVEQNQRSDQQQDHSLSDSWTKRKIISTSQQEKKRVVYRVYSREFDEEVAAASLASAEELIKLRQRLDKQFPPIRRHLSRLSRGLQRHLKARQYLSWELDQEEGELDPTRLSRVLTNPQKPQMFKTAVLGDSAGTLVTILIDNSGSMKGKPITVSALCADMLAGSLERCGIKVEILGYTTCQWHGGASRQKWLNNGSPSSPGRLNDIRHIIYKAADTPWRRSRNGLGLTQKVSLLKENIDGEALLWAYRRMLCRPESRQILMVIADGTPQDDATLAVNDFFYLDHHLRRVIEFIETRSTIELVAIGIGQDISDYYQQAIRLQNIDDLGMVMTNTFFTFFDQKNKRGSNPYNLVQ